MRFHCLNATFGKLENRTLTFADGLNIVEAPNESGKSTLVAFLRTMLYGLKTAERGTLADKNRFLPWSGKPMCGTLDISTADGDITLRRDTARANSPMGHFSAVYTGTATEVPNLTGSDCGEVLLGIPREVYERSAFIRQSGLAVDADAELERRIAALITTGEEGASYSETADKLKRQLNARKHNKTGKIPALENEIAALESETAELRRLSADRTDAERALSALQSEAERIKQALTAHDVYARQVAASARQAVEREASEAATRADIARRMFRNANTPERETLEDCRSKLHALPDIEAQRADARGKNQQANDALAAFPAPAVHGRFTASFALFAAAAVCAVLCVLAAVLWKSAIGAVGLGAAALAFFIIAFIAFRKGRAQVAAAAQQRTALETAVQEAEAAVRILDAAYDTQASAILSALPVDDIAHAQTYIDDALARYETLARLQQDAERAQMRLEVFPVVDTDDLPAEPVERPAESRETLQASLTDVERRLAESQRTVDLADARIRAIGEREALESALAEKRGTLDTLHNEYDAISLAMETLEHANTTLQTRFSPALGQRAAALFSELTDGKYSKVLLDRTFRAQAGEADAPISHDAQLLSQGAADQLYLAVRLAICEMVLPEEKRIPLILDDTLTNFDDTRCQRALELLLKESKKRQIILLTCQHRESAYLAGREGVTVLSL